MPIQLERLKRIIDAAETFLQRDRRLRENVTHVCSLVRNGRMTAQSAIDELDTLIKVTPDYHPAERVIIEEITRYSLTFKRSMSERERARLRRAGIPYVKPTSRKQDPSTETIPETPIPDLIQKHMNEDQEIQDMEDIPEEELPKDWTEEDEEMYKQIMGKEIEQ